jgi:hypothetical protein
MIGTIRVPKNCYEVVASIWLRRGHVRSTP